MRTKIMKARRGDGRAQDRAARGAEPHHIARRSRSTLPQGLWLFPLEGLAERSADLLSVFLKLLARRVLHRPAERHAVALVARYEVHVVVEHGLARGLAVRLVDRQPRRLEPF